MATKATATKRQYRPRNPTNPNAKKHQGYRFIEKDPIIDILRTFMGEDQRSTAKIAKDANLATSTLHNLNTGKTSRPQHATTRALLHALGKDEYIVDRLTGERVFVPFLESSVKSFTLAFMKKRAASKGTAPANDPPPAAEVIPPGEAEKT